MIKRFGLILYGLLSVLESAINLLFYTTFIDKIMVADFSLPFYSWYCDKFLKKGFIVNQKSGLDYGKNV